MGDKIGDPGQEAFSDFATQLRRLIPFIMGGIGIFFIVIGILVNQLKTEQNIATGSIDSKREGSVVGEIKGKSIVVDIAGAIEQPGVYTIPYDSRIANVLITAGGLSPKADRKYVSRYINLAQRVSDGMKIYVPFENEAFVPSSNQPTIGIGGVNNLININTSTVAELDALPNVGIATANKIIAGRPYQNITELTSRGIVSKSVFEKIKDKISLN